MCYINKFIIIIIIIIITANPTSANMAFTMYGHILITLGMHINGHERDLDCMSLCHIGLQTSPPYITKGAQTDGYNNGYTDKAPKSDSDLLVGSAVQPSVSMPCRCIIFVLNLF